MIPTKTIVPKRPAHLLHRPRLVDRLHRHVDLALTLLIAPAGYGKTSLLIDFAHDSPFTVCWLGLDSSDRDLSTFVQYLVAAVQRAFPEFGRTTLSALTHGLDTRRGPPSLTGTIVKDILDNIPEFFVLVLDDYHTLDDNQEINELLATFLTYRPDNCHIILSSRRAPVGLPIIKLTARSQIAGLGSTHLAFTADEIKGFLEQAHNLRVSQAQAEELATESEGWIAGILLSTETVWRGMRNSLARARTQEGPIYTYLAEEVLAEQPPHLRDFLLASSVLQEMDETLCREALGLTEAASALREIEGRSVFLTTVVDETGEMWYRYHHLFRDFLQARLQVQDPAQFRQLHQRAADWFEEKGRWESAVSHRLSAGDARAAAKTMDAGLTSLYYAGRFRTLIAWHETLSEPLHSEFPRMSLFAGRALNQTGHPDEAIPLLHQAEAVFTQQGETERATMAALARASIWYVWGRYPEVLALARQALTQAVDYPALAAEAHRLAGGACLNLGQPEAAVDHFRASLDLGRELGLAQETAMAYTDLSLALLRLGQLGEGWACQDRAIELYRRAGGSGQLALTLNNVANERYYLTGNYAPALEYLTEALEVAQAAGALEVQVYALLTTADLYRDLGALERAMALYDQAKESAQRLGSASLLNYTLVGMAQARMLAGELLEAIGLATQARNHAGQREDVYQLGLSCLTLGGIYLESGNSTEALTEIEHGRDLLIQCGARRDLTRAWVLLARARQATGDLQGALEVLDRALEVGVETQTFQYLVIEGQRAFDLLKQLERRNPSDRRPTEIMGRIRALPNVTREIVGGLAPGALPHQPALRFYGFGPGTVTRDGQTISGTAWRSALARRVLFYLLVHPPRSREQIAAVFWPDASRDKAKASFHTVKHQAHSAVGQSLISFEQGLYHVELEPDCWFDMTVFESLLSGQDNRHARLEEAVALYQGDFLEGYDGEWCVPIRERLRLQLQDALIELGECHSDQGQFDHAFETLSRAVAMDDLHEPASRALMRMFARDGRSQAAVTHYHQLVQRLQNELGTPPAPETQALYQAILAGRFDRLS